MDRRDGSRTGTGGSSQPVEGYRALAAVQLRKLAGFDAVDPALIESWAQRGRLRRTRRGEVLLRRGEPSEGLVLVIDGAVAAGRDLGLPDAHLFSLLGPGDMLGVVALFDGRTSMLDLVSHEASVLLVVPVQEVQEAQRTHAALREALLLQLAHRSRLLYERLFEQVGLPLAARLARQLDVLGKTFGTPRPGGLLISVRLSQSDLARMLGASRQQVNAELKRFAERGLVSWSNPGFTIHDPPALETSGAGKLPLTLRQGDAAAAVPRPPTAAGGTRLQGVRVLLVDDDAVTRLLLATQLALEGALVEEADHGGAAVAAVRRARFDLIVMDEQMPVQSGSEATRAIRAFQAGAGQAPSAVLGVSSAAGRNDRRRYFAAGMNAHLAKPFTGEELLAAVLNLLAAADGSAALR